MKNELERMGFAFENVDPWQQNYEQAKAYYDKHGTLVLTKEYREDNGHYLSNWMRKQYRRYISPDHGFLTDEQVKKLEEINITCYTRNQKLWEDGLSHAKQYHEQYGVLLVPNYYVCEDGFQLGKWLAGMKQRRSKGQVSAERCAALDELGMVWNLKIQ